MWKWPGCWADSEDLSSYGSGRLKFSNALQEDVIDRIRIFAEGCDLLQAGIHQSFMNFQYIVNSLLALSYLPENLQNANIKPF